MKKFLLAPALAALAIFVWGFIYWGLPHYLPYKSLGQVTDDSATALAIGKMFPASGAYLIPSPRLGEAKMGELALRGPTVEVHISKEPIRSADQARRMAFGFVHLFVICLLLTFILSKFEKAFETWMCRVMFCVTLGVLAGIYEFSQVIWWHHSLGWTLIHAVYVFTEYVIAGLVLAKFFTPKDAAPAA